MSALVSCGGSDTEAQAPSGQVAVPEELSEEILGQLSSGMDVSAAESVLGPPDQVQTIMGVTFMDWEGETFGVRLTVRDGKVTKIVKLDAGSAAAPPPEPVAPQSPVVPGASNFSNPEMRDD